MHLSGLSIYPIESGAPLAVDASLVEPRGLQHDRRWMVVDTAGRFLTGRELPRLTLLLATPATDGLVLAAPGLPTLHVAFPDSAATMAVSVWKSHVLARRLGPEADAWLGEFLQRAVHLVYMDATVSRPGHPRPKPMGPVTRSRGLAPPRPSPHRTTRACVLASTA